MSDAGQTTLSPHGDPRAWVDAWAGSDALARVVAAWGGEPVGGRDLAAWLAYLEDFSQRWDFRGGRERNLVEDPDLSPELAELVVAATGELGMRGTTAPARRRYDQVVILGGLVRACLARPRHAASLLAAGTITADRVIALGGFRVLRGDEETLVTELLDASVTDEYHATRRSPRVGRPPMSSARPGR